MTATQKRRSPGNNDVEVLAAWVVGLCVVAAVWAAESGGADLDGQPPVDGNPISAVVKLLTGKGYWSATCTVLLCGEMALILAMAVMLLLAIRARRQRRKWAPIDRAAKHMGTGRDVQPLTRGHAVATAKRLGVDPGKPGLRIGRTVFRPVDILMTFEQCAVVIAGPRTVKTSAIGIPAVLAAPGPVLVTTNKRDVIDATRDPRSATGLIRVFDPQRIVGEEPTWWFNMLADVVDEISADRLAGILINVVRAPGAHRTNPEFFDDQAEILLAGFMLALAESGQPITVMHTWLTDEGNDEAVTILRSRGWEASAAAVASIIQTVQKQRNGVYGVARNATRFLIPREITRWITPGPGRAEFDAWDFVNSRDTLYCASKHGAGNAAAVIAALTVAVMRAAEDLAVQSPGGRLRVPLVCVLDEAANVCRWPDLPDLYSHYGSRGICPITILQSWSQGVGVWGEDGMQTMWTAANVRLYGGGVSDTEFLRGLAASVGTYNFIESSSNRGRGGGTTTRTNTAEPILDVADLEAMQAGRMVVFASGTRPVLARAVPWYEDRNLRGPVEASIRAHDPAARPLVSLRK